MIPLVRRPFTRPTLPYQNTIWSHACSLDCFCYLLPDSKTHADNHAIRLPNPLYRNKTLDISAQINWASDLVPGMWIFAASRVALRKQRMKEQACRGVIMRTSGVEYIYLHFAHIPAFSHLAS